MLINACLGLVFATCAQDRLRAEGALATPAFLLVLMYACLIAVPSALYLYLAHPAWSWMYLLDPTSVSDLLGLPVAIGQGGAVLGAWSVGAVVSRRGRQRVLLAAIAAVGLVLAGLVLGFADRLGVDASYRAHAAGLAVGLMETKLGYALIALLLGQGVGAFLVALDLARDARRARMR